MLKNPKEGGSNSFAEKTLKDKFFILTLLEISPSMQRTENKPFLYKIRG